MAALGRKQALAEQLSSGLFGTSRRKASTEILLVVCGTVVAALVGLFGMMVYASPNANDQLIGKIVVASALGILVLTAFHRNAYAAAALWLVSASVVLCAYWLLWKWTGH